MHSVQLHYHQGVTDALLAEVVGPFLALCTRHDPYAWFVPHWRRGRHVRVSLDVTATALEHEVLPAARKLMAAFTAHSPSCFAREPEAELRLHRRLAELESDTLPLTPWHPDNSVVLERYDDRAAILGGTAADSLLRESYVATNQWVLDARAATPSRNARMTLALDLMILTADRLCALPLRHAHLCFRSHAEGFLGTFPESRGLRERWDEAFDRRREAMTDRVRELTGSSAYPLANRWLDVGATVLELARRLVEEGDLRLDAVVPGNRPPIAEISEYHRVFSATRVYREAIEGQPWFDAYRVLLNVLYLQLTRLGISPADRFMLCHFATRAVSGVHGEPRPEPAS